MDSKQESVLLFFTCAGPTLLTIMSRVRATILLTLLASGQPILAEGGDIRPFPAGIIVGEKLHEWTFADGPQGWAKDTGLEWPERG